MKKIKDIYKEANDQRTNAPKANNQNKEQDNLLVIEDSQIKNLSSQIQHFSFNSAPLTDPGTIALLMEGAKLLLDLFDLFDSKKDSTADKIGQWAKEISDQLVRMNKLLEDIKNILNDLKIYIDQSRIKEIEVALKASCQTYITNIEYYKKHLNDKNVQNRILTNREELQTTRNKLIIENAFADAFSIVYAFMVEVDLMKLYIIDSNELKNEITKTSKAYYEFIDMCLDPNIKGTFTQRLNDHQNYINSLAEFIKPGTKGYSGQTLYYKENCRWVSGGRHSEGEGGREVCEIMNRYSPGYKIELDSSGNFIGKTYDIGSNFGDSTAPREWYCNGFNEAALNADKWLITNVIPKYYEVRNALTLAKELEQAFIQAINGLNNFQNKIATY